MFRGINSVTLDTKGRIKLPRRYQSLLPEKIAQMIITIDTESPCLLLYPLAEWELIEEKLQALPGFNSAARRIQRLLIGHATELEMDSHGRILVPALLREYAALEKLVMLVGQARKIELWSADNWQEYRAQWIKETTETKDLPNDLQSLAL